MLIKKFLLALTASALLFTVTALAIAGALTFGRKSPDPLSKETPRVPGKTINWLLVLTDYAPTVFRDYDPVSVKNVLGLDIPTPSASVGLEGYRQVHAADILWVRFDAETGELLLVSVPGDTLLTVKNVKMCAEDIPSVYGREFFLQRMRAFLGVELDAYAFFTPQSAAAFLDGFGEVTYTVKCDMIFSDPSRGIDICVKSGSQKLNGAQAVDMLRFDAYSGVGATRQETLEGYTKRLTKKIADDFTYEEFCRLLRSAEGVLTDFHTEERTEELRLMFEAHRLSTRVLSLPGNEQAVGGKKYFVPEENKVLALLEKYRRLRSETSSRA